MVAHAQRELAKMQRRAYYLRNRTKVIERARQWRANNPEKVKATSKARYLRHREKLIQGIKRWQAANRPRVRAWHRQWEKHRMATDPSFAERRRAQKRASYHRRKAARAGQGAPNSDMMPF